ncbi:hypothetical protein [Caballeronia sp. LZ019]|uniref:hypothetical protein n=1 Tax=Caballeronia sp. LZ019 TaxID=3038555 RepID=UPI00285C54F4|nr:hypothetical protein [Caballeronia sp. LZ019]MDR5809129.1 hypothetical protein [Caballeronia sp. LZ019]
MQSNENRYRLRADAVVVSCIDARGIASESEVLSRDAKSLAPSIRVQSGGLRQLTHEAYMSADAAADFDDAL